MIYNHIGVKKGKNRRKFVYGIFYHDNRFYRFQGDCQSLTITIDYLNRFTIMGMVQKIVGAGYRQIDANKFEVSYPLVHSYIQRELVMRKLCEN